MLEQQALRVPPIRLEKCTDHVTTYGSEAREDDDDDEALEELATVSPVQPEMFLCIKIGKESIETVSSSSEIRPCA